MTKSGTLTAAESPKIPPSAARGHSLTTLIPIPFPSSVRTPHSIHKSLYLCLRRAAPRAQVFAHELTLAALPTAICLHLISDRARVPAGWLPSTSVGLISHLSLPAHTTHPDPSLRSCQIRPGGYPECACCILPCVCSFRFPSPTIHLLISLQGRRSSFRVSSHIPSTSLLHRPAQFSVSGGEAARATSRPSLGSAAQHHGRDANKRRIQGQDGMVRGCHQIRARTRGRFCLRMSSLTVRPDPMARPPLLT